MATPAATVETPPENAPPAAKSKKRLIIVAAAVALVVLLAGGAGGLWWWTQKSDVQAADGDQADEEIDGPVAEVKPKKKRDDKKHAPVFLPLDMFTVNLADREAERYAQVGVTLEVADTKASDQLKAYMPAVRNDILMLLAHKKAAELQERSGKVALANEIRRAAQKPFEEGDERSSDADDDSPVRAVHFSSFIIQ